MHKFFFWDPFHISATRTEVLPDPLEDLDFFSTPLGAEDPFEEKQVEAEAS